MSDKLFTVLTEARERIQEGIYARRSRLSDAKDKVKYLKASIAREEKLDKAQLREVSGEIDKLLRASAAKKPKATRYSKELKALANAAPKGEVSH